LKFKHIVTISITQGCTNALTTRTVRKGGGNSRVAHATRIIISVALNRLVTIATTRVRVHDRRTGHMRLTERMQHFQQSFMQK